MIVASLEMSDEPEKCPFKGGCLKLSAYLQHAVHELMCLGTDETSIYTDELSRCNGEVNRLITALYNAPFQASNAEEEAEVCLAFLMGYSVSFIDHGEKRQHVQEILKRCWNLLDVLPPSLLKLRLLTACYGKVYDESLVEKARAIISFWDSASLTSEQQEAIAKFQNVVGNLYPSEEVGDSAMEEPDINYVKADLAVRHFEDAEVNGVPENEETPLMPFVVNRRWIIEVDIKKECILDWPKGVSARINYKVCDEGIYMIYDSDKRLIKRKRGYVPDIFGQDDANFGDYVSMSIDGEGRIQNWKVTDAMLENLLS